MAYSARITTTGGSASTVGYSVTIEPSVEHIVDLSWKASPGDDIVGYNVYRGDVHGEPYEQINAALVAGALYCDNTVIDGVTYYYVVTAVDNRGDQSSYSGEAVAQVPGG